MMTPTLVALVMTSVLLAPAHAAHPKCDASLSDIEGDFPSTDKTPITQAEMDLVTAFEGRTSGPEWFVPGRDKGSIRLAIPSFFYGGVVGGLVGRHVAILTTENIEMVSTPIGFNGPKQVPAKRLRGLLGPVRDMEPELGFEGSFILRILTETAEVRIPTERLRRLRVMRHPKIAISNEAYSPITFAEAHGLRGAVDAKELAELVSLARAGLAHALAQDAKVNGDGQWQSAFGPGAGGRVKSGDILVGIELVHNQSQPVAVRVFGGPLTGADLIADGKIGFRAEGSTEVPLLEFSQGRVRGDRVQDLHVFRPARD